MLHIIGLILKIIGIVIAVILGILVLLLCIVLFVPLRYEADAGFPGKIEEIKAKGKFSWFCHLISGWISYENGKLRWRVRVAWIKFSSDKEISELPKQAFKEESVREVKKESVREVKKESVREVKKESSTAVKAQIDTEAKSEAEKLAVKEKKPENTAPPEKKPKVNNIAEESLFDKIKEKFRKLWEKIKYTFRRICDKIKEIAKTKERFTSFITEEGHQRAFSKIKKEMVWIGRFLKPRKLRADIRFGFEDPYWTGLTLARLSIIYPFFGEYMNIEPDFENKVLEGEISVKGGLRLFHLAAMGTGLILDRDVRILVRDVRKLMK